MPAHGLRQAQTDGAPVILSLSKYVRWLFFYNIVLNDNLTGFFNKLTETKS